jgi:fatty acid-binding protein DegV
LTVVVDGEPFAEGVEITTAAFYDRLAAGASVSTAAPAPGAFLQAYEQAAQRGATAILSVHIGSNTSATLDSARVAARQTTVPVELVDTGTASFPVACCVWAAGLAIEHGASLASAAAAARAVALERDAEAETGVPVLALRAGTMEVVDRARDVEGVVQAMADEFGRAAAGRPMRVGVGDAAAEELAAGLVARLEGRPEVADLVRYQVGPSVAAHTGLGTAGAVYFPAALATP